MRRSKIFFVALFPLFFAVTGTAAAACLRIVSEKFLHPAPVLLDGLEQLKSRRQDWGH